MKEHEYKSIYIYIISVCMCMSFIIEKPAEIGLLVFKTRKCIASLAEKNTAVPKTSKRFPESACLGVLACRGPQ